MAFSSKRINAYDVAQMCGVEHDEAAFVLNGLYPIIVCEGDRYFAFHNDVRLFLQNAIIHNSNIKGITESIINRIKQDRELWKYRYDISFNLLVSCKATDEVLKLIDVEYVMDSALYGISFDRILQQFILAHQLPMDNLEEVCIHSSAVSLCLAQYANCIQYYAKESDYFEAQSINKKTKAEKYCLNVKNDTPVYNFINDRLVDESAVLRPLSWHLILYVFRYFSRKWQKISDCECPDLIQNETPVRFLYGTQKNVRSDRAESSWHSN